MVKIPIRFKPNEPPGMKPLDVEQALVLIQEFVVWQIFEDSFGTLAI